MWRFKPFMHKEPTGLEGRSIDIGNLKINVLKAIAEGGFSCVYLARDAVHMSKQYALKHMICNDEESLGLVKKEISVMKSLVGHPNVVTLLGHTIFDMGRTKEAFLVMEFCEKSLVSVLESRGAGYFEEKQVFVIFRDVCNAVFAMHCQSPPIAHRDLKAENLLLGSDGLWKLCDFGSTSTNHKRFEKPEEMGIEEDNIRKYTTPAYRPPEMWDLFLREVINEKVDIWALGCLLFRICYFKSAFDGESKLQVLNGNYRIPDVPKYSSYVTDLIRDMLQARPDDRPDITQVWFRVNEQLPTNLQKSLPDRPPELQSPSNHEGASLSTNKSPPMPRRNAPPPPSVGEPKITPPASLASKGGGSSGPLGAFWSTQHASGSLVPEPPIYDEPSSHHMPSKHDRIHLENDQLPKNVNTNKVVKTQTHTVKSSIQGKSHKPDTIPSKDFEINFFQDKDHANQKRVSNMEKNANFEDQNFNTFVAEFDTAKLNSSVLGNKSEREEALEAEVEKLKEQLKEANLEKAEVTSKYEKLSAICRSQRQELQDLKQALAARAPSQSREGLRTSPGITSPSSSRQKIGGQKIGGPAQELQQDQAPAPAPSQSREGLRTSPGITSPSSSRQKIGGQKIGGPAQELQQDQSEWKTPNSEPKSWQAFPEEPGPVKSLSADNASKSVRSKNGPQNKEPTQLASDFDSWGFGADNFSAVRAGSPQMPRPGEGSKAQGFGQPKASEKKSTSQPAGWAGF